IGTRCSQELRGQRHRLNAEVEGHSTRPAVSTNAWKAATTRQWGVRELLRSLAAKKSTTLRCVIYGASSAERKCAEGEIDRLAPVLQLFIGTCDANVSSAAGHAGPAGAQSQKRCHCVQGCG